MPVSEKRYIQLALEDPDGKWELVNGCPRKKPWMTWEHGHTARELAFLLNIQLDRNEWEVIHDSGKVRLDERNYFQPDLCVVPMAMVRCLFTRPGMFEAYREALPFVTEVWSRSTGEYDVTVKLDEYKRRRDQEIWMIHPYERTVRAWRLQPDGSYSETVYEGGIVPVVSLPGVSINLDQLFR
jgi:Uma2 family endonuclease